MERALVLALVILALAVLVGLGLILLAVYLVRPALVKVKAALWKIFTLDIEIRSPVQRTLTGKTEDDERPDS
jgi:hypothetical protein